MLLLYLGLYGTYSGGKKGKGGEWKGEGKVKGKEGERR